MHDPIALAPCRVNMWRRATAERNRLVLVPCTIPQLVLGNRVTTKNELRTTCRYRNRAPCTLLCACAVVAAKMRPASQCAFLIIYQLQQPTSHPEKANEPTNHELFQAIQAPFEDQQDPGESQKQKARIQKLRRSRCSPHGQHIPSLHRICSLHSGSHSN